MTEVTTDGVSETTRRLVRDAAAQGRVAKEAVEDFVQLAQAAWRAFESEVESLGLSPADYERVVHECGRGVVFDLIQRMDGACSAW